jgi:hypothetical protein
MDHVSGYPFTTHVASSALSTSSVFASARKAARPLVLTLDQFLRTLRVEKKKTSCKKGCLEGGAREQEGE